MLHVRRLYPEDLTPDLIQTILVSAAAPFEVADNALTRHFDWFKVAGWLSTQAAHNLMFVLYVDDEPAGVMCFSESAAVHLDCPCVVEDLLYIRTEHRSLRSLFCLIKSALSELSALYDEAFLVFVGSTLGSPAISAVYKRLGFSEVGTHLVIELNAQTEGSTL